MSDVVLLGGDEFGRSSIAGRRVYRECPAAVQENDGLQRPAVNDFRSMMVGFAVGEQYASQGNRIERRAHQI